MPVFLPGKSHGQRSLAGHSQWGHKRVGHDLGTKQQQTYHIITITIYVCIYFLSFFFLCMLLLSCFSRVRLCATPETAAHQAPPPWDSAGKNTGVGCHFLLQCMKVKSEKEVAQSCLTLSNPMDCSPPDFSIHGLFQARVLEWVPLPSPFLFMYLHKTK